MTPRRGRRLLRGPVAVRATRLLVWVLVGLGSGGGLVAALRSTASDGLSTLAAQTDAPAQVTGFAELGVRRWLTVGGMAGGRPETLGSQPGTGEAAAAASIVVTATDAVATRRVGDHYWAVTVAVEVDQVNRGPALWFIEIGVVETPEGLLASGPPAVVPSPVRADPAVAAGRALSVPSRDDPLAATAEAFLEALLTGRSDVSRYLAPGTRMSPVSPAFDSVRVQRTAEVEATTRRSIVRVEALATTAGVEVRFGYELTLEQRAGRWEVRRLSGAPTLRSTPAPSPTTTSTTSPPANPTTTAVAPATPGA